MLCTHRRILPLKSTATAVSATTLPATSEVRRVLGFRNTNLFLSLDIPKFGLRYLVTYNFDTESNITTYESLFTHVVRGFVYGHCLIGGTAEQYPVVFTVFLETGATCFGCVVARLDTASNAGATCTFCESKH